MLTQLSICKGNYKLIATDLGKQQALDADMKATQQIDVTGNVDRAGNTTFFIIEEVKRFFFFF